MRMGEPELSELSELGAGGRGGWSARGASGLGRLSRSQGDARQPALYYSPPGTSYTIVERPASSHAHHRPRGTYLGSRAPAPGVPPGKKRPISPEQVLRLLGQGTGGTGGARGQRRTQPPTLPASSPPSTTHHAGYREGRSYLQSSAPNIPDLSTRTVTMSRDTPDGSHGFGICVKGGKDAGVGVYISRVEEGSVAERAGLRPGDTILQVNGTPFTGISHDEALKQVTQYLYRVKRMGEPTDSTSKPSAWKTSRPNEKMLKSCRQLSMTVRSPTSGFGSNRQTCSWMDRQGRPVSPPLEYQRTQTVPPPPPPPPLSSQRYPALPGNSSRSNSKDRSIRRVDLCIEPGQSLGLMIRGGLEYNLGIFITGVDKDSVADRAGLMIGDQILEVNGQSFLDVTHDEAVNQLKFHKRMSLLVRDVGKVPHSCTAYDHETWEPLSPPGSRGGSCRGPRRSPAAQMVEEKARSLLPNSEFPTLMYYLDEYTGRQMTVEAFVTVLLELLNTPEKFTLLTELREVIAMEDRTRFDELVYRRDFMDHHVRRKGVMENNHHHHHHHHMMTSSTMHDLQATDCSEAESLPAAPTEARSPSEDSGLGLPVQEHSGRGSAARGAVGGQGRAPPSTSGPPPPPPVNDMDLQQGQDYCSDDGEGTRSRRHSSPGDSREGSTAALHTSNYDDNSDQLGYLEGLRSSLGGWTQKVKSWYWGRPLELAHKLSRSFDMKEETGALLGDGAPGGPLRRHHSMQRLPLGAPDPRPARVIPDHHGNLHITVKKTKPILGIAIEGGANTKHPLPRIINIHENGAAHDAGGLEVGQLILEVDGRRVEGLPHQAVARLIAESFAKRDRQDIEFLVVEAKKSNLEPKPTALIFLEA